MIVAAAGDQRVHFYDAVPSYPSWAGLGSISLLSPVEIVAADDFADFGLFCPGETPNAIPSALADLLFFAQSWTVDLTAELGGDSVSLDATLLKGETKESGGSDTSGDALISTLGEELQWTQQGGSILPNSARQSRVYEAVDPPAFTVPILMQFRYATTGLQVPLQYCPEEGMWATELLNLRIERPGSATYDLTCGLDDVALAYTGTLDIGSGLEFRWTAAQDYALSGSVSVGARLPLEP